MKFFITLVISALAIVSAADVAPCDPSLIQLATGPDGMACTKATGYSPATLQVPTGEILTKVCTDPSCQKLMMAVNKAVTKECTVGGLPIKSSFLDKIPATCEAAGKAGGAGAANGTMASNATTSSNTTTPVGTTKIPTDTVMPPMDDKKDMSGSSDKMAEVQVTASPGSMADGGIKTKAPTKTTTVPTPTPKSSATSIVVASTVTAVAVVAAFL